MKEIKLHCNGVDITVTIDNKTILSTTIKLKIRIKKGLNIKEIKCKSKDIDLLLRSEKNIMNYSKTFVINLKSNNNIKNYKQKIKNGSCEGRIIIDHKLFADRLKRYQEDEKLQKYMKILNPNFMNQSLEYNIKDDNSSLSKEEFVKTNNDKAYCEIIILPNGRITNINPSHIFKLIELTGEKREELDQKMPMQASVISWLVDYTNCVAVWYIESRIPEHITLEQLETLIYLHSENKICKYPILIQSKEMDRCEKLEKHDIENIQKEILITF